MLNLIPAWNESRKASHRNSSRMFHSLQKGQRSRDIAVYGSLRRRDGSWNEPLLSWLMRTHHVVFRAIILLQQVERRWENNERVVPSVTGCSVIIFLLVALRKDEFFALLSPPPPPEIISLEIWTEKRIARFCKHEYFMNNTPLTRCDQPVSLIIPFHKSSWAFNLHDV